MPGRRKDIGPILTERRASERRGAPRHLARGTPVSLSWSNGRETRVVIGSLHDISLGGASILAYERLPEGGTVTFGLEDPNDGDRIGATVVRIGRSRLFFPGPFVIC